MTDRVFPWRRTWIPQGDSAPQDGDGFVLLPDDETRLYHTGTAVELFALEGTPCLVLLGEPGMGKSTALADEHARETAAGRRVRRIDLKTIKDGAALSEELNEALRDPPDLLAIDSLDEARLRRDTIFDTLMRRLERHGTALREGRLRLRIACRPREWPDGGADRLAALFGKEAVGVYELAPLSRADVTLAAAALGLDGEGFVAEVVARRAVPLAARPVTLKMLLAMRKRGEPLPARQVKLYEVAAWGCARKSKRSGAEPGMPPTRRAAWRWPAGWPPC